MKPSSRKTAGVRVRAGRLEFLRLNAPNWTWRDAYHWLLTLNGPGFAGLLVGGYLLINATFALLYLAVGGVAELPRGSFGPAFFFSVETLATVGYGHMYPVTTSAHLVATAEIMVGMFGMAVVTGLIFVRFSRPKAKIVFSRTLVVTTFDGRPTLMLRVANLRNQAMVEAEFRLMCMCNQTIAEGETVRRFYQLRLQVDRMIMFPAALTIRHVIDEASPLYGATPESLARVDMRFMASIVCIDTVIPAPVQSQRDYAWEDVRFGERFVEVYTEVGDNRLSVDYGRLHETEPAE